MILIQIGINRADIISDHDGNTFVINGGNRTDQEDPHKFYLDKGILEMYRFWIEIN